MLTNVVQRSKWKGSIMRAWFGYREGFRGVLSMLGLLLVVLLTPVRAMAQGTVSLKMVFIEVDNGNKELTPKEFVTKYMQPALADYYWNVDFSEPGDRDHFFDRNNIYLSFTNDKINSSSSVVVPYVGFSGVHMTDPEDLASNTYDTKNVPVTSGIDNSITFCYDFGIPMIGTYDFPQFEEIGILVKGGVSNPVTKNWKGVNSYQRDWVSPSTEGEKAFLDESKSIFPIYALSMEHTWNIGEVTADATVEITIKISKRKRVTLKNFKYPNGLYSIALGHYPNAKNYLVWQSFFFPSEGTDLVLHGNTILLWIDNTNKWNVYPSNPAWDVAKEVLPIDGATVIEKDKNFRYDHITLIGGEVDSPSEITLSDTPPQPAKCKVSYDPDGTNYTLDVSTAGCGGAPLGSGTLVDAGTKLYIRVTPVSADYTVTSVNVDNQSATKEGDCYVHEVYAAVSKISASVKLNTGKCAVNFASSLYSVTLKSGGLWNGTTFDVASGQTLKPTDEVKMGSELEVKILTVAPHTRYGITYTMGGGQNVFTQEGKGTFGVQVSSDVTIDQPPVEYYGLQYDFSALVHGSAKVQLVNPIEGLADGTTASLTSLSGEVAAGCYLPKDAVVQVVPKADADYKPGAVSVKPLSGTSVTLNAPDYKHSMQEPVEAIDLSFISTLITYTVNYVKSPSVSILGGGTARCEVQVFNGNDLVEPGTKWASGTNLMVKVKMKGNPGVIKEITVKGLNPDRKLLNGKKPNAFEAEGTFTLDNNVTAIQVEVSSFYMLSYNSPMTYAGKSIELEVFVNDADGVAYKFPVNSQLPVLPGEEVFVRIKGLNTLPNYLKLNGLKYNGGALPFGTWNLKDHGNGLYSFNINGNCMALQPYIEDSNESLVSFSVREEGKATVTVSAAGVVYKTDGTPHSLKNGTVVTIEVSGLAPDYIFSMITTDGMEIPGSASSLKRTYTVGEVSKSRDEKVVIWITRVVSLPAVDSYFLHVLNPAEDEGTLKVSPAQGGASPLYTTAQSMVYATKAGERFTVTASPLANFSLRRVFGEWEGGTGGVDENSIFTVPSIPAVAPTPTEPVPPSPLVRLRALFVPKETRCTVNWEEPVNGTVDVSVQGGGTLQSGATVAQYSMLKVVARPTEGYQLTGLNLIPKDRASIDLLAGGKTSEAFTKENLEISAESNDLLITFGKVEQQSGNNPPSGEDPLTPVESLALAPCGVHPNPTGGPLLITGAEGVMSYTLYNALGVLKHSGVGGQQPTISVDMHGWPSGIYLLELRDAQGGCRVIKVTKF